MATNKGTGRNTQSNEETKITQSVMGSDGDILKQLQAENATTQSLYQ